MKHKLIPITDVTGTTVYINPIAIRAIYPSPQQDAPDTYAVAAAIGSGGAATVFHISGEEWDRLRPCVAEEL